MKRFIGFLFVLLSVTGQAQVSVFASQSLPADSFPSGRIGVSKKIGNVVTQYSVRADSLLLPKTYLGQVATRSSISNNKYPHTQLMSRSHHGARDNITSLQIALANWAVVGTEVGTGSTASVTASIEYPLGTFTQIKFGGNVTGSIPDFTTLLSDAATVAIPKGATFWVRYYWQNSGGWHANNVGYDNTNTNGDAVHFANSGIVDQTMSGTVQNDFTVFSPPCAIVAQTTNKSVLIIGDSKVAGQTTTVQDASADFGNVAPSVGPFFGYINAGVGGDQASTFVSSHARRASLAQWCSSVVIAYGINDLNTGRTTTQLLSDFVSIGSYFTGKRVFIATIEPKSTDATTVNAINTNVVIVNKQIRGGIAGYNGEYDFSDVVSTDRDTGLWKTAFSSDFLHNSNTAVREIKKSGVIDLSTL